MCSRFVHYFRCCTTQSDATMNTRNTICEKTRAVSDYALMNLIPLGHHQETQNDKLTLKNGTNRKNLPKLYVVLLHIFREKKKVLIKFCDRENKKRKIKHVSLKLMVVDVSYFVCIISRGSFASDARNEKKYSTYSNQHIAKVAKMHVASYKHIIITKKPHLAQLESQDLAKIKTRNTQRQRD